MKITEIQFGCNDFFIGGDFKSEDNYVVVNDKNQVVRNGKLLEIDADLTFSNLAVSIISDDQFLFIEREISSKESKAETPNSYLINGKGEIENTFYLGSVSKIVSTENHIVCSYSDAELDTNFKYATNGLVVFDLAGNSLFEYYRDEAKSKWLNYLYNYAFYKENEKAIYFLSHPNWQMIEFNLENFSSRVILTLPESAKTIDSFWNPHGFSRKDKNWFFITPDYDNWCSRIFRMNDKLEIEEVGKSCFSISPKGLKEGKFFAPFSGGNSVDRKCQLIEM